MSMSLMVEAMKAQVGSPLRKLVLIKLADNANDEGKCWPSYKHIADQCEIARSTVKSHIRKLEEAGFLRIEYRKSGHLNQSNIFHLTIAKGNHNPGRDLTGVGRDLTEGGATDNPPGATDDRGGGATDDPRTSHSFEPVKESVNEPEDCSQDSPGEETEPENEHPKTLTEDEFNQFWSRCRKHWFGEPGNRTPALKAFRKIKRNDISPDRLADLALQDARNRNSQQRNGQFASNMKHASGWLNNRCWEDVEESPVRPVPSDYGLPKSKSEEDMDRHKDEIDEFVRDAMAQGGHLG